MRRCQPIDESPELIDDRRPATRESISLTHGWARPIDESMCPNGNGLAQPSTTPRLSTLIKTAMKSPAPLSLPAAIALAGLASLPLATQAACPSDVEAAAVAAAIVAREPVPIPAGSMTMADGLCGRDKVVAYLAQHYGPIAGYKAGLFFTASG